MGHHTFDAERADKLEQLERRYRFLSAEELLWALALSPDYTVADLGSGTGFYTDEVAPHAADVYAVDVQEAMHEYYREKGIPENVELVTTGVDDLPFADNTIDAAFSMMTYHEFASDAALDELARVIAPDGLVGIADWTRNGTGSEGPPTSERYALDDALTAFGDAGFEIEHADERRETFVLSARRR